MPRRDRRPARADRLSRGSAARTTRVVLHARPVAAFRAESNASAAGSTTRAPCGRGRTDDARPGLYVAGDASRAVQWAVVAAAEGAEAAYAINQSLLKEDLAAEAGRGFRAPCITTTSHGFRGLHGSKANHEERPHFCGRSRVRDKRFGGRSDFFADHPSSARHRNLGREHRRRRRDPRVEQTGADDRDRGTGRHRAACGRGPGADPDLGSAAGRRDGSRHPDRIVLRAPARTRRSSRSPAGRTSRHRRSRPGRSRPTSGRDRIEASPSPAGCVSRQASAT